MFRLTVSHICKNVIKMETQGSALKLSKKGK